MTTVPLRIRLIAATIGFGVFFIIGVASSQWYLWLLTLVAVRLILWRNDVKCPFCGTRIGILYLWPPKECRSCGESL
jgi:hypothetical protein